MTPFALPTDYARVKRVKSFDELVSTRFAGGVNALCWQRTLPGDYGEVVGQLIISEGITSLDEARLNTLSVSAAGRIAIDVLVEDLRLLRDHGLAPTLDCIQAYPRDVEPEIVRTDVYSFHADSATAETDTYLCTYHGPASEGLRNEEAQRRVDLADIRTELLKRYGGKDDDDFLTYLNEHCYDLHYAPVPHARPFSFGQGNLWRIAVEYPGCPVPPCIHRAPDNPHGHPPRLLLIS